MHQYSVFRYIGPVLYQIDGGDGSDALEHVHVLILLIAAGCELQDTPARAELREHPLGGQERGAPVGVDDAPVALLAELGGVPGALAVERADDLVGLLWRAQAELGIKGDRSKAVRGAEEMAPRSDQAMHLLEPA